MREIKFRAWYENKMYEVFELHSDGAVTIPLGRFPFIQNIIPDAVVQYTGLKDKNGKEVYEGDVIDCTLSPSSLPHMGEVVYSDEHCSFGTKNDAGITLFYHHNINTREIIGTIYENPELLNKDK